MNKSDKKTISLQEAKKLYGGYWRYDVLDFHYLYNPYFPTKDMTETLSSDLQNLIDYYPSSQKVIAQLLSRWNTEAYFNADNLIVGNGTSELIKILKRKVTNAIIPIPTFNEYIQFADDNTTFFLAREEDNYYINEEELYLFVANAKKDYLILVNPNNPTGQLFSTEFIENCLKTGTMVIVDEAFIDWNGAKASCEPLVEKYENLIILKSLTKAAGCGGLRLGYMLTTNRDVLSFVRENLPIWNVNGISERFLELLIENKKTFLEAIEKTIVDRETLKEELRKIDGIIPMNSKANFIFCRTKESAKEIEADLFEKYKVMIKAGVDQGGVQSDSFIRIGVKTTEENKILVNALRLRKGDFHG